MRQCPGYKCLKHDDRLNDLPQRPIEEGDIADVDDDDGIQMLTPLSYQAEVISIEGGGGWRTILSI